MTRVRARGEDIRRFILEHVEKHPNDISKITAEHFGITRQGVNKHLQRLRSENALGESGKTRNRAYKLAPLLEWIAGTQANWLYSAGIDAFAEGSVVHANGSQFEIVNECSSLVMIALLAALLFAGGKKSDWKALAIGVPLLFAFNLLRLFATIAIGASFGDGALDPVHYLLWIVDAGLVLAVWLAFGRKKEENKKNEKDGEQEHK